MRENVISVTEAARNFAGCVNRVRSHNDMFVLLRNGRPVARLVPDKEKICTGRELAEILAKVRLTDQELKAWRRDLRKAYKVLKAPAR